MSLFDVDVDHLPKQIEKNNLLEAIIEIRYDTNYPVESFIGKIYDALNDRYDRHQSTGAMHLPQALKEQNPELQYVSSYFFEGLQIPYKINIGEKLISLSVPNFKYKRWEDFYAEFHRVYDIISANVSPKRIGVRYVNVFDKNILDNIKVDIKLDDKPLPDCLVNLGCEFEKDDRVVRLMIANKAQYSFLNEEGIQETKKDGFVIDIDVLYQKSDMKQESIKELVDKSHKVVKSVFFGLFSEEFIQNDLKPTEEKI